MKIHCIYKIVSTYNGKFYIGSAVNYKKRRDNHRSDLRNNKHGNRILQNHANKYGLNDLIFYIVEILTDPTLLIEREQHFINLCKPHFNICKIAGSVLGKKATDETKRKLSESHKGYKPTIEAKMNMSIAQSKRKRTKEHIQKLLAGKRAAIISDETKEKMRLGKIGTTLSEPAKQKLRDMWAARKENGFISPNKGRIHSEATKEKVSAGKKGKPGKPMLEKTKKILSAINKGKSFSTETRKKISDKCKGRRMSEEAKRKLSESRKGIIFSEQHKQKLKEAAIKRHLKL